MFNGHLLLQSYLNYIDARYSLLNQIQLGGIRSSGILNPERGFPSQTEHLRHIDDPRSSEREIAHDLASTVTTLVPPAICIC